MRLLPDLGCGTGRYPEKVARRLRTLNLAAWCTAGAALAFALLHAMGPDPRLWLPAAVNLAAALLFALVPLLHRFGPAAAPAAGVLLPYAYLAALIPLLGTGTGMLVFFLLPPVLAVLMFGPGRPRIALATAALSVAAMSAMEALAPRDAGLLEATAFRASFVASAAIAAGLLVVAVRYLQAAELRAEAEAERERARSDALLANMLPASVASRLREQPEAAIADRFESVSVLFADIEGFTARAARMPPEALVAFLNRVFSAFDAAVARHGLEKIKTSGDSYMVASGAPAPRPDHAAALARLALEIRDLCPALRGPEGEALRLRIGLASGPVVAGVVGTARLSFDIWGDTVNLAARMESTGEPGRIQLAPETARLLGDAFVLVPRGVVEVKGRGPVATVFLEGPRDG